MAKRERYRRLGALALSALMLVSNAGAVYADADTVSASEAQEGQSEFLSVSGNRIALELSKLDLYAAAQRAIDEGEPAELGGIYSPDEREGTAENRAPLYELELFSRDSESGAASLSLLEEAGGELRFFVEKEERGGEAEKRAPFALFRSWFRKLDKQEVVLYEAGSRFGELLELFYDHGFPEFTEAEAGSTDETYQLSGRERITVLFGNTNTEQPLRYQLFRNGKALGQEITVQSGERAKNAVLRSLRSGEQTLASRSEVSMRSSASELPAEQAEPAGEAEGQTMQDTGASDEAALPSQRTEEETAPQINTEAVSETSEKADAMAEEKNGASEDADADRREKTEAASEREEGVSRKEEEAAEGGEAGAEKQKIAEEENTAIEEIPAEEGTAAGEDNVADKVLPSDGIETAPSAAALTEMDRALFSERREAWEELKADASVWEGVASAVLVQYTLSALQEQRQSVLTAELGGKTFTVRGAQSGFPQDARLLVAELPLGLAAQILSVAKTEAEPRRAPLFAYDLKIAAGGEKYLLPEGETVEVTLTGQEGIGEEALRLVHIRQDLMDDAGRLDTAAMEGIVEAVRKGKTAVDAEQEIRLRDGAAVFSLDGFSTVIGAKEETGSYLRKASLSYTYKENNVTKTGAVDLLGEGESEVTNIPYQSTMRLEIEAEFGAGRDKTIEVSIPKGLSFRTDYNRIYVVEGTDATLKGTITPAEQTLASKKNETVLGQDMYNGTLTLQFHSLGEENDAKRVKCSIPITTSWAVTRHSGLWESGIGWFYDEISMKKSHSIPLKITQFINGRAVQEVQLDRLTMQNEESKRYDLSWKAAYGPDIPLGGQMSGSEIFQVLPLPNGGLYTNAAAYRLYSITYIVPEGAEFAGFGNPSNKGNVADFADAKYTVTTGGHQTENGYTVPAGMTGYTWTIRDKIVSPYELKVSPIWKFPDTVKFRDGYEVKVAVSDVKVRYYGRDYAENEYENYEPGKYPSLRYRISADYEEVFVNTAYDNGERLTDGYEADGGYKLYLGAPGYEHRQERKAGYFLIGNRGTADSAPKTVTIRYDHKESGAIGVTEQRIPASGEEYQITKVQAKLWNSRTGEITDWQDYTGTDNRVNRTDFDGVRGDSDIYLKELRFDISTIPAQCYLSEDAGRDGKKYKNKGNHSKAESYEFYANVLSEGAYPQGRNSEIESELVIANQKPEQPSVPGDAKNRGKGSNSRYADIVGRANNGLQGKSLVGGNNRDYDQKLAFQTGTVKNRYSTMLHFHDWSEMNAQDVDAIYLISPFGEPYENIRMHYSTNGKLLVRKKQYAGSGYDDIENPGPQPKIEEHMPSESLLKKYPKAKLYRLDFSEITGEQERYDARRIGGNVITSKSLRNTPYATGDKYNGVWLSFDYSPKLSDPAGSYDDLFWVEYRDDAKVPIDYVPNGHNCPVYDDVFALRSIGENPAGEKLGRMHTLTLTASEGLAVSSAAKQSVETEDRYRTFDETDASVMGMYKDADYRLNVKNETSLPVSGLTMYWPVPKEGENWGSVLTPDGAFRFSMRLANALQDVPQGFKVYYARNVHPTGTYEKWEGSGYPWIAQSETAAWKTADWNAVNLVKLEWIGTEGKEEIVNGDSFDAVFHLTVDTTQTKPEQMYQKNVWRPYFLRSYRKSTSWAAGEAVAAMLTPGYLGGTVWEDQNCDGVMDAEEPRISGALVELFDISAGSPVLRMTTRTNADGSYRFNGLKDGTAGSGKADNCRIVVHNLSEDPGTEDAYMEFTAKKGNMRFDAAADQRTASASATPEAEEERANIYDAGLIKAIPVDAPNPKKTITGDAGDRLDTITFRFRIEGENGTEPLPVYKGRENTEAVRSVAKLEQPFGTIPFRKEGSYSYRITELPNSANERAGSFVYDPAVYHWTVELRKDGSGIWGYRTTLRRADTDTAEHTDSSVLPEASAPEFINTYRQPQDNGSGSGGGGGGGTSDTPRRSVLGAERAAELPGAVLGAVRELAEPLVQRVLGASRRIRTGDRSQMTRMALLFAAAASGLAGWIVVFRRRRKK